MLSFVETWQSDRAPFHPSLTAAPRQRCGRLVSAETSLHAPFDAHEHEAKDASRSTFCNPHSQRSSTRPSRGHRRHSEIETSKLHRRARRFTAPHPLLLGHHVAAWAFSSLDERFAVPSILLRRVALQHLGARGSSSDSSDACGSRHTCRLGRPIRGRDHRAARERCVTPTANRAPVSTNTHSGLPGSRGFAAAIPLTPSSSLRCSFPP